MSNLSKSFYLQDLLTLIDQVAIESQLQPSNEYKKQDGTMMSQMELLNLNNDKAFFNGGVLEMAERLRSALHTEASLDDSE